MSSIEPDKHRLYEPRHPALIALAVFALATLTLCWPMFSGQLLLGDDQYLTGFAFRQFGAEMFRATGSIPQWNPYIFGGLPFVAAMHGDIFYPTAWLRWFLPVGTAMNIGFAAHLVLAGVTMYAFQRALRVSWTGALVGGLAYQLSGIVASMVSPGHDGKLFVSALAPLAFLALLRAIRERKGWGFGLLALTVGLAMVSPHYQMTYYLLVASGLWTLWLVFLDPERPADLKWPVALGLSLAAVILGVAISAIQALPFIDYIPYSPRGEGGPSTGWEYATQWAMPGAELWTTILPQFNGVLQNYWGENPMKAHTEYLGASVVLLAVFGVTDRKRGPVRWALLGIAGLFLLVALGGHTPFYRLWYEVMPMMKSVRAAGMAFYLPALVTCVCAGFGVDRLLRRDVAPKTVLTVAGVLAGIALLGIIGVLQAFAEALALPARGAAVVANAGELRAGSLRLLLVAAVAGGAGWAIAAGRLRELAAAAALAVVVFGDLWSINRQFFHFRAPESVTYRDDEITSYLRRQPLPYRVFDYNVYQGSVLMTYRIPTVLGYHGNEVRFYDELLGGKNVWANALSPKVLDLVAMRFLILPQAQELPGFRQVAAAPVTFEGTQGVLMERDSAPPYVRVLPAAAKIPEQQVVPTVLDPNFPTRLLVLYPDSASVSPAPLVRGRMPEPARTTARMADWAPGKMRIELAGTDPRPTYLLVSETWYKDWQATVDGKPAPVHRGNHAFLSVELPSGAKEVRLEFRSRAYQIGRVVTLLALLVTAGLLTLPLWRRGRDGSSAHAA